MSEPVTARSYGHALLGQRAGLAALVNVLLLFREGVKHLGRAAEVFGQDALGRAREVVRQEEGRVLGKVLHVRR